MDVELSCADSNNDHIAQRKVGITYLRHGGQQLFCLVKCFKQNAVCCLVRPRSMVIERSVCDDDGPDDGCGQWQDPAALERWLDLPSCPVRYRATLTFAYTTSASTAPPRFSRRTTSRTPLAPLQQLALSLRPNMLP